MGIKIKAIYKIEKYTDDVSKEDIESGKAIPIEVIEFEEEI